MQYNHKYTENCVCYAVIMFNLLLRKKILIFIQTFPLQIASGNFLLLF